MLARREAVTERGSVSRSNATVQDADDHSSDSPTALLLRVADPRSLVAALPLG
jgi:hypothetical protein